VVGAAGFGAAWVVAAPRPAFQPRDEAELSAGDARSGKRVFDAAACASCHASPGQPNRLALGGGMALASPFGTFYPPNISQDRMDGIGQWRAIDIANAVMAGVSPSGQHYYPALPYVDYVKMTRADMADLIAYLRTLPAVPGGTHAHDLPALFKIRFAIGFWKAIYFDRSKLEPDPAHDSTWNRGRYLVHALSHCGECHSPHNLLDAVKEKERFAGGQDQSGVGFVPNITPAGIGSWSERDIVESLTSGWTPEGRKIGSSMADMVLNTSALPEEDRVAVAAYVKSLPPRTSREEPKTR
jgi:mono/diheme cytochrome c family protein